jgi:hypothetical protein
VGGNRERYVMDKRHPTKIHNRVTAKQIGLKSGDAVTVLLDDGTRTTDIVESEPYKMSGHTWVVRLANRGVYALCRARYMKVVAA